MQKRFGSSHKTYNRTALVQVKVAGELSAVLPAYVPAKLSSVFEVGCGPATLTRMLVEKFAIERYQANDIVDHFKQNIDKLAGQFPQTHFCFEAADAEQIDFPANQDLIVSSSTIQWFQEPARFFEKAFDALRPGGVLAVTSFGSQNLKEIKALTGVGLSYCNPALLAKDAGFLCLWDKEEQYELLFESPRDVLLHLRETGVNGCANQKVWTPATFRIFCADYNKLFSEKNCVRLTYHTLVYIFRKPDYC